MVCSFFFSEFRKCNIWLIRTTEELSYRGSLQGAELSVIVVICLLLVFNVTPFKIDQNQNQNQNRAIDKVQNPRNERRYIYKEPRQDSGQRNISYARYPKKSST